MTICLPSIMQSCAERERQGRKSTHGRRSPRSAGARARQEIIINFSLTRQTMCIVTKCLNATIKDASNTLSERSTLIRKMSEGKSTAHARETDLRRSCAEFHLLKKDNYASERVRWLKSGTRVGFLVYLRSDARTRTATVSQINTRRNCS